MVGTALLNDKDGSIVAAIERKFRNDALEINREILNKWLQGQGMADCTWRGLLGVLTLHYKALAESVEEALIVEEATDADKGKLSRMKHINNHIYIYRTKNSSPLHTVLLNFSQL